MIMFEVYIVTNLVDNKKYVGITRKDHLTRWKYHKLNCYNKKKPREYYSVFYKALRRYSPDLFIIKKIDDGSSWKELCDLEKKYISLYRTHYKDGYGYNMTYGGDGVHGHTWKLTKKQLENRPPHVISEDGKRRISESKLGSRNASARSVIINNHQYGSIKEAADFLGLKSETLRKRILNENYPDYKYADGKSSNKKLANKNNPKKISVVINNEEYASFVEAAKKLGISRYVIRNRIYSEKWLEYKIKN